MHFVRKVVLWLPQKQGQRLQHPRAQRLQFGVQRVSRALEIGHLSGPDVRVQTRMRCGVSGLQPHMPELFQIRMLAVFGSFNTKTRVSARAALSGHMILLFDICG